MGTRDIIVIGSGMAGMTSALYALRGGKTVAAFEKESIGGQIASSPRVENFPSHLSISGEDLANATFDQITSRGAEFIPAEVLEARKLGERDFAVVADDGEEYRCKSVILACGARHKKLNVDGEERLLGNGVSYCAVCDGPFFEGREVALVGDGNSAMQYALHLSEYCPKVSVCTWFDKFFGDWELERRLREKPNISIVPNVCLEAFEGETKLTGLHFRNRLDGGPFDLRVDGCFVAIGQVPCNERFSSLVDLDSEGFAICDESCATRTPGVFVAGDCRKKSVRQLATAVSDGAIAALSAINYLA